MTSSVLVADYTKQLMKDVWDSAHECYQTGWTVCGAEDPSVIQIDDRVGEKYPELKGYSMVRVVDVFLNEWNSKTELHFSNEELSDKEYQQYEKVLEEEDA